MALSKRKLPAMHEVYGVVPGRKCRDCWNLRRITVGRKQFCKCAAYDDTNGSATDWGENYLACGLVNVPFEGVPLLEQIRQAQEEA